MSKQKKDPVRFVPIKEARDIFSALLLQSQSQGVVIMKNAKPYAVLLGVEGKTIQEAMAEAERGS